MPSLVDGCEETKTHTAVHWELEEDPLQKPRTTYHPFPVRCIGWGKRGRAAPIVVHRDPRQGGLDSAAPSSFRGSSPAWGTTGSPTVLCWRIGGARYLLQSGRESLTSRKLKQLEEDLTAFGIVTKKGGGETSAKSTEEWHDTIEAGVQ